MLLMVKNVKNSLSTLPDTYENSNFDTSTFNFKGQKYTYKSAEL